MFQYTDYLDTYGRIMQFNKNKSEPFHRWYPFVEGYSKEFIISIINEIGEKDITCLEPFSGSGTTALELQNIGIKCYSFEVNPLMYLISKVKLTNDYNIEKIKDYFEYIKMERSDCHVGELVTEFKTLYQEAGKSKWNYNSEVIIAIEKLKTTINSIDDNQYSDLFLVALASILLDVSNLYRNGKCLSYKNNWENRIITQLDVFNKFDLKVKEELLQDLTNFAENSLINNKDFLFYEDSRIGINENVPDESIDLVITSPPYLNSRDYTDTYILELKTLGLTNTKKEVRELREKTIRSHVQIHWEDESICNNELLLETLERLKQASKKEKVWNDSLLDMIRLYFVDIQKIFSVIHQKMKDGGKIYFNVSNSAYFGELINTLEISSSIAQEIGFTILEIRKARYLNTSPQQKERVDKLLEGVILMQK